ncbi:MAG: 2,3-bisphosphoglycerate-independent phosphoglycerate mutase [Candidatus Magasanikbacteria bacterium]
MSHKPIVLTILDGFGIAPDSDGNAVTRAAMPNYKKYLKEYPAMSLHASGAEVGLLFGQMGNSEVGHLNIGAGRIYYQSCPRLDQSISDESFFKNKAFLSAIEQVKKNKSQIHLIGLIGVGKVHASDAHLYALLELCKREKLKSNQVFIHAILDGRDCIFNSGAQFIKNLQDKIDELGIGQIASLCGRFYALDRDNRWDRVEKAYCAIALGQAERKNSDPIKAISESYAKENYDEEFIPTVITGKRGDPITTVRPGDSAIFFNFRPDRARELTKAFTLPGFDKFSRSYIKDLNFVTMMEYEKDLPVTVAYGPQVVRDSLAEVVSKAGLKQFHVAETQKYAHITFFLNGTIETPFDGEERAIVPSAKVANFAEKPEMSAREITKEAVKAIDSGKFDFVAINIANPDMVGHTGDLTATKKACAVTDECLGKIVDHALAQGGVVVLTADHGNAEEVLNLQTGAMDKEHSTNPVPLLIIGKDFAGQAGPAGDPPEGDLSLMRPVGMLSDIAPTILKLMGVDQPEAMTGRSLI